MDVDADTLKYIDDGTIDATISQKPFSMGYIGLRELDLIHHDPHHNFKPTYPHSSRPCSSKTLRTLRPAPLRPGAALPHCIPTSRAYSSFDICRKDPCLIPAGNSIFAEASVQLFRSGENIAA
jgi:hypothetical protein